MRQIFIFTLTMFISSLLLGQSDGPKEMTPQALQKIKAEVEIQATKYKATISKKDLTVDQIEFSVDTFKTEQIVSRRMDIDYSTAGMKATVIEMTDSYDKLLNKYYNKLLKTLKEEDKKIFISAQRAWLGFRDAEAKLIGTVTKKEYSGGGTIQTNIATGSYSDLVVQRTLEIFNYFEGLAGNQ